MDSSKRIRELRESVGESRREFSEHLGIPVRTIEDWEAGRRTPPEYIPRLIAYQLELEKLKKENQDIKHVQRNAEYLKKIDRGIAQMKSGDIQYHELVEDD